MNAPTLHFTWSPLAQLTPAQVLEMVSARIAVFVVEQNCPYQEVDAYDASALHLFGWQGSALAAYARIIGPNLKFAEPSIGRVMVAHAFRAHQYGRALMQEAIDLTMRTYPGQPIRLSAQSHLQGFYGSLGFVADSPEYLEDGIPHVDMLCRQPRSNP
ncbi:GNAT family N-acetyltransferase [Lampropedia puyangensis]|uniref:GNAT family N-acetyltransferase n=1 Tax=Lampropedia puyangensis TaxID=1330072 RepID=A0A4S8EZJ9_9BURK|nr:GNAT family N-acetyltransferase [Lampropedia puyangensis]THT99374.1 GNAT family N-acetyltransferase [Lampropedia puyangensis]